MASRLVMLLPATVSNQPLSVSLKVLHRSHHQLKTACFIQTKSCDRARNYCVQGLPVCCTAKKITCFEAKRSFSSETKTIVGCEIDMRSDTVTKPTPDMYNAMMTAEVGDDIYDGDPTVTKLQDTVAKMMKMDGALFVPSGTMGNLISIMAHCQGRGEEILLGDQSHIIVYEQAGAAQIANVSPRTVKTLPDGTLCLEDLESKIRWPSDPHYPITRLICLENTHNATGGRVLPLDYLIKVRALADKYNLKVHIDGARVMNAVVALGVMPDVIMKYCDSVSICFSKGLGCPVGSIVVGEKQFIARAVRHRKVLGGGMRQCGILAAAALIALDKSMARLHKDHENAQKLAKGLADLNSPVFTANPKDLDTNMVLIHIKDGTSAMTICKLLASALTGEETVHVKAIHLKTFPASRTSVRAVLHQNVNAEDVELALKKCKFVSDLLVGHSREQVISGVEKMCL